MINVLPESPKQDLSDLSSRYSLGHPFVWLGITLVLLIVGYTWLSVFTGNDQNTVPRQTVKKLSPSAASAQAAEIAASAAQKQSEMPITRQNDKARAQQYLEYEAVEQQILPLLDSADVHFENEQYVQPADANAWQDYQAILAIQPEESIAIAGLTKIKSKLIANAEQAIDSGEFAEAENWLVQLDQVQPENTMQSELRAEISQLIAANAAQKLAEEEAEALQQKIQTTLDQAATEESKSAIKFNKIKDLYDRVLELDEENAAAKAGLLALSDLKLDEAERYLQQDELGKTKTALEQAGKIYSDNKRISSLNLALNASLQQKQQLLDRERQDRIEQQRRRLAEQAELARKNQLNQQTQQQLALTTPPPVNTKQSEEAETLVSEDAQSSTQPSTVIASGVIDSTQKATAPVKKTNKTLEDGIRAYYNGDYNRSFELLFPLAQEGVARAQFRIGIMYRFGRSVSQNLDLAEKWFTAALPQLLRRAQQGAPWAQTDLGTAYEFGISLQQDYERAAYWYKKAADQGYAGAQTNLGVLYAQGDGVDYDRSKSIFWLRRAAAQGDQVAADNLKILGVTQ